MAVTGPGFISLQVRDLARSAAFYEEHLGLRRQDGPPHAVVFDTAPIAFAVRDAAPGVDLDASPLGVGVAVWMHAPDTQGLHDALVEGGVEIASAPIDGPFGRTFTLVDPDGYLVTLYDRA
ncbi:VOC family protein [Frondihabitans peucedani]|uniref:VOC family protein n=1 Tax=Frondihabitans peucedani TaxID=598626 RepID=A0ABP8E171_9MICO